MIEVELSLTSRSSSLDHRSNRSLSSFDILLVVPPREGEWTMKLNIRTTE